MITKRKFLEIGGVIAGLILIVFGVVSLIMGLNGRSVVRDSLQQEAIVGSPDMTPAAIRVEAQKAGLDAAGISFPTKSVADLTISNGDRARTFAQYMRIHALEATGGYTYAQMGRFQALPNTPKSELQSPGSTNNAKYAVIDPKTQRTVDNGARNIWITETALTTALNTSYMAEQLSLFSVVIGVAFLLTGVGFTILALGGALRRKGLAADVERSSETAPVSA